jgi:hypothetical protein
MEQHQQRALFYDTYRAALREDCKAIADMSAAWSKIVGAMLWPGKDPIEAGRALLDRTNPERKDRLAEEEERLIMRLAVARRGFSAAHDYISDEIGMERAKPKDRRDEALELQARGERLLAEFQQTVQRFERLVRSPLTAVDKKTA